MTAPSDQRPADARTSATRDAYWLDWDDTHPPGGSAAIRFVGHRVGTQGFPDPRDRFDRTEQLNGLLPGCGRVSITTKVAGINPGQWQMTAQPGERHPRRAWR